jgi:hypothetical protein
MENFKRILLTDDTVILVSELKEGVQAFLLNEEEHFPLKTDGKYITWDGEVEITIKDGKIEELKDVPPGISDTEFKILKNKHGKIYSISVPDDDGNLVTVWFKKPDMELMDAVDEIVETKPVDAGKLMYNTLIIGGKKEEVEADAILKRSVIARLADLFKIRHSSLKKW